MPEIQATTKDAYRLIHEGILAFSRAEMQGLRIDAEYCQKKKDHLTRKIQYLHDKLAQTKFYRHWQHIYDKKTNIYSNHQLSRILYKVMKIEPPKTTTTGQGATDEEALSQINLPELQKILEIRKLAKIRDTYLDAFLREQVDGYIHPFFNLHTVRTYRSSSDHPNFQNIPKRDEQAMQLCRRAIFPRPGHQILAVDFSGIEVRIACCYTEDEKLIYDTLHGDMHGDMAVELFKLDSLDKKYSGEKNLRQGGKNGFVFPQFYGDYHGNCALNLLEWAKIGSLKDGTPALEHMQNRSLITLTKNGKVTKKGIEKFTEHVKKIEEDFWNRRYKGYKKWKDRTWNEYQKKGYIKFLTGFTYKGVARRNELLNAPIQGSAFHSLLWCFIEVDKIAREEEWDTALCGQIHDEMLTDTNPDELEHVAKTIQQVTCKDLPEAWPWWIIPPKIEADLCPLDGSWNTKQEYKLPEVE